MNCQITGLTSIRKGLRKDHITFLVDTNSTIASENVSGGVYVGNQGSLGKAIFTKPEASQSGGVQIFPNSEGSQSGGVLFSQNRRGPIRRDLTFAKPEGSQSGGVSILPIRRGTVFCQPGGVLLLFKDLGKQKKRQ